MKHINSFFKTATDQGKKYHTITDDAKFMEKQFKFKEAKEAKELTIDLARLADIADKAKRVEVSNR